MNEVQQALALWGLEGADYQFVAGRENRVYRVGDYALRLRRPGYRSKAELDSELLWMAAMADAGLSVPAPLPGLSGDMLGEIDGQHADMIGWLPGQPLGQTGVPLALNDAPGTFHMLGRTMAQLHNACDRWSPSPGFTRCHWNAEGLVGDTPLWGRFWENPALDADTRDLLARFRDKAAHDLTIDDFDTGLIHADLVRENVLLDSGTLHLIDFNDGGYGFRLFDIATALLKNRPEPNYDALQTALIAGYREIRGLETNALPLFMALRAATYVGWIVPRMDEDGAPARNARFIRDAQNLCSAYLAKGRRT